MAKRKILAALLLVVAATVLAAPKGDAERGARLVAEHCAACHGPDGNSPVPSFPNLAGQHAEYLLYELKLYREEHRISEMMQPLVQHLGKQDMEDIAVFLAAQKPVPGTVTDPTLLPLGRKIYFDGNPDSGVPACDGCHEADGSGSARFPRLAGQNVEYTMEQFRLYVTGKRPHGKKVMRTIAERLTEQEIRAVAEFMASLP